MTLKEQQRIEAIELGKANEALSNSQRAWLRDIVSWVKEEIDQDPKGVNDNYRHFLKEQAKVFAYQTGLEPSDVIGLVNREFRQQHGQPVHAYAQAQWKAHLFKSGPQNALFKPARKQNKFFGHEM